MHKTLQKASGVYQSITWGLTCLQNGSDGGGGRQRWMAPMKAAAGVHLELSLTFSPVDPPLVSDTYKDMYLLN